MSALPIQFRDFTFIDLGSGKGRSLLMASDYPFRRIVGVEYLPDLHRIAEGNIARYSSEKQQCREIHSICQDARDFEFPAEPTVLYLFNPFPEPVFARVMGSLKKSLEDSPRPFYVAYRYQEYERLLIGCEWLEKIAGTEQWVVYSYRNSGREFSALSS
jgi:SAM-dependent methyltransferase